MSKFKGTNFIPKIKFDKNELKERLSSMQYNVTQEKGTERPFSGQYYSFKEDGTYKCIVCDEQLFKSSHKFDSGCGWPSFYDALDSDKVHLSPDYSHDLVRTEVSCAKCGAHLGHLFDDGPKPTKLRYCINSNSLNFKAKNEEKK